MSKVKIFVASSSELKKEREETIQVVNELRKIYPSHNLEAVKWETDIPSGSYDKARVQDEINPLLEECDIVLVLFYSKVGKFTMEEYRLARGKGKKVFIYFKTGYSPKNKAEHVDYGEVFNLKEELERENRLIFREYRTFKDYREILKDDLILHLAKSRESIRSILFRGSKTYNEKLRGVNGRFRSLKISDIILPGAGDEWLETFAEIDDPQEQPPNEEFYGGQGGGFLKEPPCRRSRTILEVLPELWKKTIKHTVIVGDGGMGKTVSLVQWWKNLLDAGEVAGPVPVYMALNEYNQIGEGERKDFIIKHLVDHYGGGAIDAQQAWRFMQEPIRNEGVSIPSMVLLLDGFNEITMEKQELLLELNRLVEQCPGVQVVLTSRYDMRGNFNWSHWNLARLQELADNKVEEYLKQNGKAVPGQDELKRLLRNPMMLTLYAATCEVQQNNRGSKYYLFQERVSSSGELLYNFMEAQVVRLWEREACDEGKLVYYRFLYWNLLPALGYEMEKAGLFDLTRDKVQEYLHKWLCRFGQDDYLNAFPNIGEHAGALPIGESNAYRERSAHLLKVFCKEMYMLVEEGKSFRFLHQNFRDFFAAVHILNEVEVGIKEKKIPAVLQEGTLDYFVRRMMGEIEGEHNVKYDIDKKEKTWCININKNSRLYQALEICRRPQDAEAGVSYAVWNILAIWKEVRGELSGADLSGLDLSIVTLNGIRCSRFYDARYLAAVFNKSRIHKKNLLPQGHTKGISSAVYSPDGKKILSTSDDKTIKEWDAATGVCLKTISGHKDWVKFVTYSPNGKKILSTSNDRTIMEWNASSGVCVKKLDGHTNWVNSAMYSPDGKKILSASGDKTIKEWDTEIGKYVKSLEDHTAEVTSAVYSPDGGKILSASWDQTIKEWDAATGHCVRTLVGHENAVNSAVYSPDGKKILSASDDKTIKEWDAATGKCIKNLLGHTDKVNSAVYSQDGKKILSASSDLTIKEWDATTGDCVQTIMGYNDKINKAVYSLDKRKILFASDDHTIKEWDVVKDVCVKTIIGHTSGVTSAAYSPDGKIILSTSDDDTIKEWDAFTGECLKTYQKKDNPDQYIHEDKTNTRLIIYGNNIYIPDAGGRNEKYKTREIVNIPGLFIQGCSFHDLEKGSEWTKEELEILKQYGGEIGEW